MIFLACFLIYYILGLIFMTSVIKAEEGEVLVNNIPMIVSMSFIWPGILLIWGCWTIFDKWGDKKIL